MVLYFLFNVRPTGHGECAMGTQRSFNSKENDNDLMDKVVYFEAAMKIMSAKQQSVEQFLETQRSQQSHLGTKHVCETCSTKYYDSNKSLECPQC